MAKMDSVLEAARMDTMKGYSSGLQVESAEDVRIWLSICSEECAGFIRDVIGCVSQFDVLLKGVRCGDA